MGVVVNTYPDRKSWLDARAMFGIGASEIGAVLGDGFKTPLDLWREKRSPEEREDLSDNPRVQFGNDAEEPLRGMFRLMHPEYDLTFEPYQIYRQEECDYLFYTPDGLLTELATGRRGLLEMKTSTCLKRTDWAAWDGQIPKGYFDQICQGMYCAGLEFAVLWALLLNADGDATLRAYQFERADCEWKIGEILREGKKFMGYVHSGVMPPTRIVW